MNVLPRRIIHTTTRYSITTMFSTYAHPPPRFPNEKYNYTPTDPPVALLPLHPPPRLGQDQPRPTLDRRRKAPLEIPGYTLSRHTFPAAWPRTLPGNVCEDGESTKALFDPYGKPTGAGKAERKEAIGKAALTCAEKYTEALSRRRKGTVEEAKDEKRLWSAMDRYTLNSTPTSTNNPTGDGQRRPVTLLCCHANGFHKEMFVPTLNSLLPLLSDRTNSEGKRDKVEVEEILLVDIYNHGESYLLNDGNVGVVGEWGDTARDLISLLQHCLPPQSNEVDPTSLAEGLDFRSAASSSVDGLGGRRVIGIGHSIGGNSLVQAAHAHPDLFDSLVLIDPMTRALEDWERLASFPGGHPLIVSCIGRRETWSSREEAREGLIKSPYFQAWDKGVFDSFIEYGLIELDRLRSQAGEGQRVTLTTPRWAEAEMFAASRGMFDGYDKLAKLRKDMKVTFVMAEDSSSTGGPVRTHHMVWIPPRSENYIVKGAGHLVMQEKPAAVAQVIYRSLMDLPVEADEKVYADKAKL